MGKRRKTRRETDYDPLAQDLAVPDLRLSPLIHVVFALASAALSYLVSAQDAARQHEPFDWINFAQATVVFTLFVEVMSLQVRLSHVGKLFEAQRGLIASLKTWYQRQHALSHSGFRLFQHQHLMSHRAAGALLFDVASSLVFDERSVGVQGGDLATTLYHRFWDELRRYQASVRRKPGRGDTEVYVIHSSSIAYWEEPKFQKTMQDQRMFAADGGRIYRIMIRDSSKDATLSPEALESERANYRAVIAAMEAEADHGIKVFYLETPMRERPVIEAQLSRVDRDHYSLTWTRGNRLFIPDDIESSLIDGCEITKTPGQFPRDLAENWSDLMHKLAARAGRGSDPLSARPDKTTFQAMLGALEGYPDLLESHHLSIRH